MLNPININQNLNILEDQKLDSLKQAKTTATSADDEKLKKAATEFEAVFLTKMLTIMDSTVERSGFMGAGKNEKMFKSMMHQQMAMDMASNPSTSVGLAKQIYEQMKNMV